MARRQGHVSEEPEQLVGHGGPVDLLGPDQGEALGQVEADLSAEDAGCACSGPVAFGGASLKDAAGEVS